MEQKLMTTISTRQYGVTLIEVMIVVAIIGILAAIAYPSYQNQIRETRRTDATNELMQVMSLQQRFYANNFPPRYTEQLQDLGFPSEPFTIESGHYSITTGFTCPGAAGDSSCVGVRATPIGSQMIDGVLTLDSRDVRTRNGNPGWD